MLKSNFFHFPINKPIFSVKFLNNFHKLTFIACQNYSQLKNYYITYFQLSRFQTFRYQKRNYRAILELLHHKISVLHLVLHCWFEKIKSRVARRLLDDKSLPTLGIRALQVSKHLTNPIDNYQS